MINKMSKKTLLWTSAVSLVLCVALVIGIVAMIFVGSGTNRVTTANLDLELWQYNGTEYVDITDDSGDIFTGGKDGVVWEPGKIELAFFQVKNTGSTDISYNVTHDVQMSSVGIPSGLSYAVVENMSYDDYSATNMETWKTIQKSAAASGNVVLGSTTTSTDIVLAAGESSYFIMAVHMDDKAEAAISGITFDVTLSGKQLGGEEEEQTVFYVSPTGHDGNPGTEAEPLKSLRRVSQIAKPGQTYIFEDGVYNESAMTVMMNSGTEEAPITIKARNPGKAKIMYPESLCGKDCWQIKNKEYITVEGLEITQAVMADMSHANANMDILVRVAGCNNITFRNCTLHHVLEEPLKFAGCSGILVEGCYIYDVGQDGIDFVDICDSVVRNNKMEDCGRVFLMCKGGSRSNLFYNNYMVNKTVKGERGMDLGGSTDNVSTWGCTVNDWEAFNCYAFNNVLISEIEGGIHEGLNFMGSKDCGFFNNVVIGCTYGVSSTTVDGESVQWEWSPTVNNPQFKNNIVMNSLVATFKFKGEPVNPDFDYNLYFGNAGAEPQEAHSIVGKDPMFVADKSDWHLKAGGPAIGAGVKIEDQKGLSGQSFFVGYDHAYIMRGDTWDIGVYDMDGTETYEPGGLVFQDPAWIREIDHTIYEAPEVGSMPEAGTVLVENNFDTDTSMDKWLECARGKGKWEIKNGLMTIKEDEFEGHVIVGARDGLEWSDYEFSAKVMAPSKNGPSSGIIFRADESMENMYGFRYQPESGGELMEFCVWNDDKFASLKTFRSNWTANKIYELKVIAVGSDFEFYLDGKKVGTASDSTHLLGTPALYAYRESRVFDEFKAISARGYQVTHMQEVDDTPQYTGKILYEENFSSSDAINNWKQYSGGEWKVDGGIMSCELGVPGENITVYEGGYDWVNYEFTCKVRQPEKGGMWAGLIFRCNDNKTGYYGFRFVNDNTQVVKGWPANWTQMGVKAMSSLPKGKVAELKVIVIDDTFRCYLDGMKVWEDDDKSYKKGSIGLFQQNMTEVIFDDIVVKEIVSEGVEVEEEVDTTPTGTIVYQEDFSNVANADKWMNLKGESGEFAFTDGHLTFKQTGEEEGNTTYLADGYWKNYTMVLNMTLANTYTSNGWFQIHFRTTDGRDGSYFYLMNLTNSDRLRIVDAKKGLLKEIVGGAVTSYHDGKEHEIKIKIKDNTVEFLIDDWSIVEYQSDKLCMDPGSIGFSAYNSDGYKINDIKIYCDDNPILSRPAAGEEDNTYVPQGTLVLDDKMSAASNKWEITGTEYGTYTYADGKVSYTQVGKDHGATLLYKDGYWKNFTLMFDATFPRTDKVTSWLRIGLRTTDGQDKPFAYFQNLTRDYLKVNEGIEELKGTYGGTISKFHDGKVHKVRIEVKDDTIEIFVDNESLLSAKNERIVAEPGTISFTCFGNGYTFSNVKVYTTDNPIQQKPAGGNNNNNTPSDPGTSTDPSTEVIVGNEIVAGDMATNGLNNWKVTQTGGGYAYKDGALQYSAATNKLFYEKGNWTNFTVTFKVTAPVTAASSSWLRVQLRSTNGGDGAYVYFQNLGTDYIKIVNSANTTLKEAKTSAASEFFNGKEHFVKIVVEDTTVALYVDGKAVASATDDTLAAAAGSVGFVSYGHSYSFSDLKVYEQDNPVEEPDSTEPTEPEETEPGQVLYENDFTSTDSTGWNEKGKGSFAIEEGALKVTGAADAGHFAWFTSELTSQWKDYEITAKINVPDGNGKWSGLMFRTAEDASSYYYVYFVNGEMRLRTNSAAVATSSFAKDGQMHDLKITVKGNKLMVYLDGTLKFDVTNDSIAAGTIGVCAQNMVAVVDDLKVVNLGAKVEPKVNVVINAQFNDNDNELNNRIEEFIINLNGNGKTYPASIKAADSWTYTFDVPKFDDQGNEITYSLGTPSVAGYRVAVENGNKVVLDPLTTFNGSVVWNHDDNQETNRPANIKVTLMRGATAVATKIVTEGEFVFENLDQFYNGTAALYSVMVDTADVPTGYKVNISNGVVNVNYMPEAVDLDVKISFDDGDNVDEIRPESVKVTVTGTKGGAPYSEAAYELTAQDSWENTLSLRKSQGGEDIVYTVSIATENLPEGYTAAVSGTTITLTHAPESIVLMNENFEDAGALNNWTALTPPSTSDGSYAIADGKLTFTHVKGTDGVGIVANQVNGSSDVDVSLKMKMPTSRTWVNIVLRATGTDTSKGIRVNFYNFGSGANRKIRIYNGGTLLKEVNGFASSYYEDVKDVKISLIGNTIKVSIAGDELVNYTDDALTTATGTKMVLHTYGYAATFDDIKVVGKVSN